MLTNILIVSVIVLLLILLVRQQYISNTLKSPSDIAKIHESIGVLKGYIENLNTSTATNIQDVKTAIDKIEEYFINTRSRGHVGERLLDEALRSFGFIEGKDYLKQKDYVVDNVVIKPDVTFLLPNQMYVFIDSKFPLDNYRKYLETKDSAYLDKLANDVQKIIKDLSSKPYINENTVDFVIMFIGSEAVYDILYENYYHVFEEAFNNRIILCSPNNLYPVLAVLRRLGEYKLFDSYKADIFNAIKKISTYIEAYNNAIKDAEKSIGKLNTTIIQMEKIKSSIQSLLASIGSLQPNFSIADINLTLFENDANIMIVNPNLGIDINDTEKGDNNGAES